MNLTFHPVTLDRWPDLQALFLQSRAKEEGAPLNCWCMEWRLSREQFERQSGDGNRQAMKAIVDSGQIPGILAYAQDRPIGWCSISPRRQLRSLEQAGRYRNFDNPEVWVVMCFYVPEELRGKGVMTGLLGAAVEYATNSGARVVEGYPIDPETWDRPDLSPYVGLAPAFRKAGFAERGRFGDHGIVMRYHIPSKREFRDKGAPT